MNRARLVIFVTALALTASASAQSVEPVTPEQQKARLLARMTRWKWRKAKRPEKLLVKLDSSSVDSLRASLWRIYLPKTKKDGDPAGAGKVIDQTKQKLANSWAATSPPEVLAALDTVLHHRSKTVEDWQSAREFLEKTRTSLGIPVPPPPPLQQADASNLQFEPKHDAADPRDTPSDTSPTSSGYSWWWLLGALALGGVSGWWLRHLNEGAPATGQGSRRSRSRHRDTPSEAPTDESWDTNVLTGKLNAANRELANERQRLRELQHENDELRKELASKVQASLPGARPAETPTPQPPPVRLRYAPALPDTALIPHTKVYEESSGMAAIQLELRGSETEKAEFVFNPKAEQKFFINAGLRDLNQFFEYDRPAGPVQTIKTVRPGILKRTENGWLCDQKARIELV